MAYKKVYYNLNVELTLIKHVDALELVLSDEGNGTKLGYIFNKSDLEEFMNDLDDEVTNLEGDGL